MKLLIHIDGASRGNPGPSSVGVVVKDASGRLLRAHGRALGRGTNNAAEYAALCDALSIARELGAGSLSIFSDSELLVRQYNGQYRVKSAALRPRLAEARSLAAGFSSVVVAHVRREENSEADRLANEALDAAAGGRPA